MAYRRSLWTVCCLGINGWKWQWGHCWLDKQSCWSGKHSCHFTVWYDLTSLVKYNQCIISGEGQSLTRTLIFTVYGQTHRRTSRSVGAMNDYEWGCSSAARVTKNKHTDKCSTLKVDINKNNTFSVIISQNNSSVQYIVSSVWQCTLLLQHGKE